MKRTRPNDPGWIVVVGPFAVVRIVHSMAPAPPPKMGVRVSSMVVAIFGRGEPFQWHPKGEQSAEHFASGIPKAHTERAKTPFIEPWLRKGESRRSRG